MAEPPATSAIAPSTNNAQPPSIQQTVDNSQEHLDSTTSTPLSQSPSLDQSPEPQTTPSLPDCINSVTDLRSFSDALSAFYRCFDDLKGHLDSIKATIDFNLDRQNSAVVPLACPPAEENHVVVASGFVPISSPNSTQEIELEKENEKEKDKKPEKDKQNVSGRVSSEVESLCAMMSSRGLRRYMLTNLGQSEKLREEVPKALKLAPNPAKLVLECSGRFFLQGKKAYTVESPMIAARDASVLTLECFLLMEKDNDALTIEKEVIEEAERSAKLWKKRLLSEGGLSSACEIDARGLLMFLGCYGVPSVFRYDDIRDLVNASNVKGILGVLKRSTLLMEKITDAIDELVKNKMGIDAVDMAYSFDVQDKINPQTILSSFLRDAKESLKKVKKPSRDSSFATIDANKKQLAALRSLVKCVERHNIDVAKVIPGAQIDEMITSLENKIAESESEKALQKRKADEIDSSRKLKNTELKRMRHTIHGLPQQRGSTLADGQRNFLDRIPGHPSSSYVLSESISGSVVRTGGSALTASGHLQTAPYTGGHGESLVDSSGHVLSYSGQHYSLHGDATYEDRLAAHYAGQRPSHDLVAHYAGQQSPYDLAAHYAGQHPTHGASPMYRPSAPIEGYVGGLPPSSTAGVASRTPASDLYQFADAVVESDLYPSRALHPPGSVPSVAPSHHHSSYLY